MRIVELEIREVSKIEDIVSYNQDKSVITLPGSPAGNTASLMEFHQ